MLLSLILSAFLPVFAASESLEITNFRGLNNSADSTVINDGQSQDLLNVEANKSGNGIRKRAGYATSLTLSTAAPSVTSIATVKNSNGDECTIAVASGTVYRSTNQGNPVQITTITAGARLYCATNNGTAFCYSSSGSDSPFSYNCLTFTGLLSDNYPNGKFAAFLTDRQVVSGTTSSLNSLYFSKSGDFDEFDTGTAIEDSWVEDVGTAGDRVTGLWVLNGRVIAFKEYAIVGFNCTDQFNCPSYTISNTVGIANQEAIVEVEGKLYFKASDNEFYVIDGAPGGISNISLQISSTTASLLTGKSRYSLSASKSDWDAGNLTAAGPGAPMRTDIVVGSVMPSSATKTDTTTAEFELGTLGTLTARAVANSIQVSTKEFNITNGTFETGDMTDWTCIAEGSGCTCAATNSDPISGTYSGRLFAACGSPGSTTNVYLLNGVTHSTVTTLLAGDPGDRQVTVDISAYSTQTLKIRFYAETSANKCYLTSSSFTAVSSITWQHREVLTCTPGPGSAGYTKIDGIRMNRYFALEQSSHVVNFQSRVFDMGVSTPIGGTFTASSTTPAGTSIAYQVRSASSSSGEWSAWGNQTNLDKVVQQGRYYQYLSSFTTNVGTSTPNITDVSLIAATSGQYISRCIQPGNQEIAWGTIEVSGVKSDGGSFVFQNSTGTTCSDAGSTYTSVTTGAVITIATAPAYYVRITFNLTSGTSTARVDSLRVNWTEGNVAPPTYGTFWNDDIYWSVANAGTTNNRVLKLDLLYNEWYLFDIAANALSTFNNSLYFGCVSCGKIYKYSDINYSRAPSSDDGLNINAYYKTKDYSGSDRYVENQYDKISLIAKDQASGSMTVAWALNGGQTGSGSYTVQLSTGDNAVRSNYQFPAGRRGAFSNLQFSNNSTSPFEVLGVRLDFTPQPWRPLP